MIHSGSYWWKPATVQDWKSPSSPIPRAGLLWYISHTRNTLLHYWDLQKRWTGKSRFFLGPSARSCPLLPFSTQSIPNEAYTYYQVSLPRSPMVSTLPSSCSTLAFIHFQVLSVEWNKGELSLLCSFQSITVPFQKESSSFPNLMEYCKDLFLIYNQFLLILV